MLNLTYFHPERGGNLENKSNSPVNIRFVAKTSDIRNLSENVVSDVKPVVLFFENTVLYSASFTHACIEAFLTVLFKHEFFSK